MKVCAWDARSSYHLLCRPQAHWSHSLSQSNPDPKVIEYKTLCWPSFLNLYNVAVYVYSVKSSNSEKKIFYLQWSQSTWNQKLLFRFLNFFQELFLEKNQFDYKAKFWGEKLHWLLFLWSLFKVNQTLL